MPASAVEVSERLWPLVVIRIGEKTTPEDWEQMFATFERIQKRRERIFTINDGTNAGVPTARERAVIAQRSKEHEAATRRILVGSCVMIPNALLRGALTAINWIAPPVYTLTVVGSLAEAYVVAAKGLRDAGIPLHPDHEALVR